jgi:hypothetical protein
MEQPEIPEQHSGTQTNTDNLVTGKSREEAQNIFKRACKRLLNINIWHKLGGTASAEFSLINNQGEEEDRLAKENDYFKIDIPAPGSKAGDGYDWVKVEKIEDRSNADAEEETFLMRVRPSTDPNNRSNDVAHFLSDDATSTFIISRKNNTVTASVHGRNEKPNTEASGILNKIRNAVVGTTAAAGVSKIQWKLLVKGLLADEVPE